MWKIKLSNDATKQVEKLDATTKKRIVKFIIDLAAVDNPRQQGKALKGKLSNYWRYRVGDFRIICEIIDNEIAIVVIEIGHRKEIYRKW